MPKQRKNHWMPLFIGDYLGDTSHLTTEEHGAYLLLLMRYWQQGHGLPDDDHELATITRLSRYKWKKVRPKIEKFFVKESGILVQKRVEQELEKSRAISKARAEAGAKGGRYRPTENSRKDAGSDDTDQANTNTSEGTQAAPDCQANASKDCPGQGSIWLSNCPPHPHPHPHLHLQSTATPPDPGSDYPPRPTTSTPRAGPGRNRRPRLRSRSSPGPGGRR